jgi:hypothetical protein
VNSISKINKVFLAIITFTGAFALIGQLWLIVVNRDVSLLETLTRYFSFFTIQCNILVTVAATCILFTPSSKWGKFFSKSNTLCALAVFIFIVGLTYNIMLRNVWNPTGFQRLVDELLHVVMPLLFVIYWFALAPKTNLSWSACWWLIYPAVYVVYTFIRGTITDYYPYPFFDVNKLGVQQVALITGTLVIVFVFLLSVFIIVGKIQAKRGG